ncbi:hypothetical protein Acsp05_64350 [Actinokineospora sp. NBRC 105648]|nr:hypothetical protein Acsp05_64350 [Actinokineospora sp. NBRC 105648]
MTSAAVTHTVPYVTAWSSETTPPARVIAHPAGGIAYPDETVADRDRRGILWTRAPATPGTGRPIFGGVHPLRQRRAMRRLLCQVCGGPAHRHPDGGVMWMLRDFRQDWPGWPAGMGVTEPPICKECADLSARLCPVLRRGHVLVRVGSYPIAGVWGATYEPGPTGMRATSADIRRFDDPLIRWTLAHSLVRQLDNTTIVESN